MSTTEPLKITQITACMTRGKQRDFANVYGLTSNGNVAQWDPSEGRWKPFRITGGNRREDF